MQRFVMNKSKKKYNVKMVLTFQFTLFLQRKDVLVVQFTHEGN